MVDRKHSFSATSKILFLAFACLFSLFLQDTSFAAEAGGTKRVPKRKVLIFCHCDGFYHQVIPTANRALQKLGEESGAFQSVVSDDINQFTPENLAQYDAILLNNTTQLKFTDPSQQQALLDFVKSGRGLIGAHAATDNFYDWPEGAEMMGGLFDGHPWTAGGTWVVKIDEPDHPLNAAFKGQSFYIKDEIYQFKVPYSRKNLRVLLSLDWTDETTRNVQGIKREDNDFAISWIRSFGKGRVFYCSLGHNPEVFENPVVMQHYLAGIRYALGDLNVDDAPLKPDPYKDILKYKFGQSGDTMMAIEKEIWSASRKEKRQIEKKLLAALNSPESTYACKMFVCRMLRLIGTSESVNALANLLPDATCSHLARYALEQIDSREVDRVFRRSLYSLKGDLRVGAISSIAGRNDRRAVEDLAVLLYDDDPATVEASLVALGRIGGSRAIRSLLAIDVPADLQEKKSDALLRCANQSLARGRGREAEEIFHSLTDDTNPVAVRTAAYAGLVRLRRDSAMPLVLSLLKSDNDELRDVAGTLIEELPGKKVTRTLSSELAGLSPEAQVIVITALGRRGDRSAAEVLENLNSNHQQVRMAVVKALGVLGGASSVPVLAKAALEEGDLGEGAAKSLTLLPDPKASDAMILLVRTEDPETRIVLIDALVERREGDLLPVLLDVAKNPDSDVRIAANKALEKLATEREWPALISLLVESDSSKSTRSLEKALVSLSKRITNSDKNVKYISAGIEQGDEETKTALIGLLPNLGGEPALTAVREKWDHDSEAVKMAALKAMAKWPDVSTMDLLKKVALDGENEKVRLIALRGYIDLVVLPSNRSDAETVKLLADGLAAAGRKEEMLSILSLLPNYPCPAAAELAESCLINESIKDEAEIAIRKIKAEQVSAQPGNCVDLNVIEVEDGKFEIIETSDSSRAWTFSNHLYFAVQDYFCDRIEGKVQVECTLQDRGEETIRFQYDSKDESATGAGAYKNAEPAIQLTDTGKWRTITFNLDDAKFSKRQNEGTDFRFQVAGVKGVIKKVRLIRIQ